MARLPSTADKVRRGKIQITNFLIESDVVSLSSFLYIQKGLLCDRSTLARHQLHPLATEFLEWLRTPRAVAEWTSFAKKHSIKPESLREIAIFLNEIGGLWVNRSRLSAAGMFIRRLLYMAYGLQIPAVATRWPNTFVGLIRATTKSSTMLGVMLLIVGLLTYLVGFSGYKVILYSTIFYLVVWTSTLAHEMVHMLVAQVHQKNATIVQRGMRLGILHRGFKNKKDEILSSLGGPIAGSITALVLSVIFSLMFGDKLLAGIGVIVILLHIASLLPLYGDGGSLLTVSKRRIQNEI